MKPEEIERMIAEGRSSREIMDEINSHRFLSGTSFDDLEDYWDSSWESSDDEFDDSWL